MSSITPSDFRFIASIFRLFAASAALVESLKSIDAHPSGEITEYTLFSSIRTESATPIPNAPPLPPSPIITETIGTFRPNISARFLAMASPCPFSSASIPGYAPAVSIRVNIGNSNLSAILISLNAFLYPSGLAIPKFLNIFESRSLPF